MTPFQRTELAPGSREETIEAYVKAWKSGNEAVRAHFSECFEEQAVRAQATAIVDDERLNAEIYINNKYQVNLRRHPMNLVHLSIKLLTKDPVHDWRDLQQIKNELVGPECEGIELYPAESRLVDGANQYHLWVWNDPTYRIPIGFNSPRSVSSQTFGNGKQRPYEAKP